MTPTEPTDDAVAAHYAAMWREQQQAAADHGANSTRSPDDEPAGPGPLPSSTKSLDDQVKELAETVAKLRARVAEMERERTTTLAATRRLGMDVVTLGQALADRVQTLEAQRREWLEYQNAHRSEDLIARLAADKPQPHPLLRPIIIVTVSAILVLALIWVLPHITGDGAPKQAGGAHDDGASPVVMLGDTQNSQAITGTDAADQDQNGHVLYGTGSASSAASAARRRHR